ncbi:MAG TPA: triple tyrosine motif-containing protein, partial [Chitinophagaceae bacterium]|nr:triple tyrosine motif-containing protein [Chitinophagaceae bacterium]
MKDKLLIIFIICCTSLSSVAQQFIVKSFDNTNGLISASNNNTYQDSSNFYWISAYGGLVRFDGSSFKAFRNADGIHDYLVNSIFERRKNDFILCNQFSLLHFDGVHFKTIQTNLSKQYQYKKIIRLHDGTQLLQTNLGVMKFQNDSTLSPFIFSTNLNPSLLHEYLPNSLIAYFKNDHKIQLYENGKLIQQQNLEKEISVNSISNLGSLPIINTNKGVFKLNKTNWIPFLPDDFKEFKFIKSAFKDSKNRIWFTDPNNQLWLSNDLTIQNLSKRYSTKSIIEPSYIEDRDGNIVVTSVYGVLIFRESGINEIEIEEINSAEKNYTLNLYSSDTMIVALSPKGFIAFSKGKKRIIPISSSSNPCKHGIERCDFFPKQNPNEFIVRITNHGLYNLKKNQLSLYHKPAFNSSQLLKGHYDALNDIYYAGGINTLFRITEDKIDSFDISTSTKGLPVNTIHQFQNNQILFSLGHERLFSLFNNNLIDITSQLKIKSQTFSTAQNGNSLWIIVHGVELQEYQIVENKLIWKRTIGKAEGLVDANIAKMNFDDEHNIWLNSFSGIYLLKLSDKANQITGKKIILHLGNSNAPMINNILYHKKHLFALGIGSIIDINQEQVESEIKPSATYFSSIEINSVDINKLLENNVIQFDGKIYTLPTKFNSFLFQCNSIYFGFDDGIQYQYKLDGSDHEWKNLNATNSIQLTNLNSGHYILNIRSINKLSYKTYSSAQFEFMIEPPFWQTWWFRILL